MICCLGDAGSWAGNHLLAPILTGIFVGIALRSAAIIGEVTQHDLRAEELNTDLTRWVGDRTRQLEAEVFHALNLARQGVIEDVAQMPVPKALEGTKPGDMSNSGAFKNRILRLMRQTLHQYRDEASGKVREYRAMARSETWLHRALRRLRQEEAPRTMEVTEQGREEIATWRKREVPNFSRPTVEVKREDDPTFGPTATEIRPLEEDGLTWARARTGKRNAD